MELPQIMGILNVTPDSFSDGGKYFDPVSATDKANGLVADGADILDVGAQSTRPGYVSISAGEEILRIRPVLERLSREISVPISVDTYYAEVATLAADFGVKFLNVTYGFTDIEMAQVAKSYDLYCIINYCGPNSGMRSFFLNQVRLAKEYGIDKNRIYLDPGIGFGKTFLEDFDIITNVSKYKIGDYPVLLGISRKRVVHVVSSLLGLGVTGTMHEVEGLVNQHEDYLSKADINSVVGSSFFSEIKSLVKLFEGNISEEYFENSDDRDFVTGILNIVAARSGANLLRVHNVRLSRKILKIYEWSSRR